MSTFNILVVDDVSLIRNFVRHGLIAVLKEIKIMEASNGRRAQDILLSKPIDIVLCDLDMPEINGHDLLVWVRNNKELHDLPFIMITGSNERKHVVGALKVGIDGYLVKPFSIENLATKVKEALTKRGKNIIFVNTPITNGPFSDSVAILTGGQYK
ncbi:hypothetical protein CCP3SC5AM1_350012 [Gammaproteobacteria bacterium]